VVIEIKTILLLEIKIIHLVAIHFNQLRQAQLLNFTTAIRYYAQP
jgi:hypothetical protein